MLAAEIIVGEEPKQLRAQLKDFGIPWRDAEGQGIRSLRQLNEHSTPADVEELADLCATAQVALVSDCGTPGFCDPGASLVAVCRKRGLSVTAAPGPSSLMTALMLSSRRIDEFVFVGFLPANSEERHKKLQGLRNEKRTLIFMDTPYRLEKTLQQLSEVFGSRTGLLAADLTLPTEWVVEAPLSQIAQQVRGRKAEFVLVIYS